jgi:catechol 2,3-dioxygenase-like lactoylglutathione lyase family enzyme
MAAERLIIVQRTDLIAVPTRNRERAVDFYERTLGPTRNPTSSETWIEFETPVLFVLGRSPARAGAHDLALRSFRRRVESS